jgi:bifunctional non-homologous end joining protein LigD
MKIPMLATLVDKPFDGEDWIFEVKWDGYRALAHKKKEVILLSRGQKPWNEKFPTIAQELKKISGQCILDGEIVILDKKGKSNFQMLQNYQKEKKGIPLYYVFDILSYQGKDLTKLPLLERKKILHQLLKKSRLPNVKFSSHIEKKGKAFFQKAKKKREEGIIAKKKLSTYQFHRSRDWLKIKTGLRQEVVIGGFTQPKGSRHRFGALLVGVYSNGHLIYVGHVGGGFSRESLEEMHQKLKKIGSLKCPFQTEPDPNTPVSWVRPRLVCEVSFAEWTKDGKMRQPIFRGLRVDKSPKSVIRERSS